METNTGNTGSSTSSIPASRRHELIQRIRAVHECPLEELVEGKSLFSGVINDAEHHDRLQESWDVVQPLRDGTAGASEVQATLAQALGLILTWPSSEADTRRSFAMYHVVSWLSTFSKKQKTEEESACTRRPWTATHWQLGEGSRLVHVRSHPSSDTARQSARETRRSRKSFGGQIPPSPTFGGAAFDSLRPGIRVLVKCRAQRGRDDPRPDFQVQGSSLGVVSRSVCPWVGGSCGMQSVVLTESVRPHAKISVRVCESEPEPASGGEMYCLGAQVHDPTTSWSPRWPT